MRKRSGFLDRLFLHHQTTPCLSIGKQAYSVEMDWRQLPAAEGNLTIEEVAGFWRHPLLEVRRLKTDDGQTAVVAQDRRDSAVLGKQFVELV